MYTYFITSDAPLGSAAIKIGRGKDPEKRLQSLRTARTDELRIIATIAGDVEKKWHKRFDEARIRGEWFRPSEGLLRAIASESRCRPDCREELLQQFGRPALMPPGCDPSEPGNLYDALYDLRPGKDNSNSRDNLTWDTICSLDLVYEEWALARGLPTGCIRDSYPCEDIDECPRCAWEHVLQAAITAGESQLSNSEIVERVGVDKGNRVVALYCKPVVNYRRLHFFIQATDSAYLLEDSVHYYVLRKTGYFDLSDEEAEETEVWYPSPWKVVAYAKGKGRQRLKSEDGYLSEWDHGEEAWFELPWII